MLGWWHDLVRIVRGQSVEDLAFAGLLWVVGLLDTVWRIESEVPLSRFFIRSVACETVRRENRAYIAIEIDLWIGCSRHRVDGEDAQERDKYFYSIGHEERAKVFTNLAPVGPTVSK